MLAGHIYNGEEGFTRAQLKEVAESTNEPIRAKLEFVPSLGGSDAILWGAAAATGALWTPA